MISSICFLGIDPGISGAIAFYFPSAPDRVATQDMPIAAGNVDAANLAALIAQMRPDLAIVERVASRPGQGVASVFKFGAAYGAVIGCLAGVPFLCSLSRQPFGNVTSNLVLTRSKAAHRHCACSRHALRNSRGKRITIEPKLPS
jgi:hypothetical protein